MSDDAVVDRTLSKNKLREFILRVDLIPPEGFNFVKIVEALSKHFDSTEKRQISGFTINFTNDVSEFSNNSAFDYVLVSKSRNITMTFSEVQNAFWIASGQYKNNAVYKDIIKLIIEIISKLEFDLDSKRIGLRYINDFSCNGPTHISKIYGPRLSGIVKGMVREINQSRIIGHEEYNYDDFKLRLQYGVPNKFYPAVVSVYDLLLDIDAYSEDACKPDQWEEVISRLNHAAYERFLKEMSPKFLEGLK